MRSYFLTLLLYLATIFVVHAEIVVPDSIPVTQRATFAKNTGNNLVKKGKLDSALMYYKVGIEYAEQNEQSIIAAGLHNNTGVTLTKQSNYLQGIQEYEWALEIYREAENDSLLGQSLLNMGILYKEWNAPELSMSNLLEAIDIFEVLEMKKELAATYNALGNLHLDLNEYEQALKYLRKGLQVRLEINNVYGIAGSYNSIARYHELRNQIDSALFYARKAHAAKRKLNKPLYDASSYSRIGEIFYNANILDSAFNYSSKALKIRAQQSHKSGMAVNQVHLGKIYLAQEKIDSAIWYLNSAYLLFDTLGNKDFQLDAGLILRQAYLKNGSKTEATQIGTKLLELKESINAGEREKRAVELEIKYRVKKKNTELELQETKISKLYTQIILFLAIGVFLLLTVIIFIYFNRNLSKQKLIIEQQRNEIQLQHKEYKHRISNNLSTFSGILAHIQQNSSNSEVRKIIKDIDQKLLAINLVNQSLDRWIGTTERKIDLKLFIRDLIDGTMILHGYNENKLEVEIESNKAKCSSRLLLPITVIINEVFTNAFKYAIPKSPNPKLAITLVESSAQLTITIQDNGPGFSLSNTDNQTGSGMSLIASFADGIKASQSYYNDENGVRFQLIISK